MRLLLLLMFIPSTLLACSGHGASEVHVITTFDECVEHGNRILRTNPPRCVDSEDGKIYVQGDEAPMDHSVCKDQCGDGTCNEIVCLGTGCPCAETPESCPADCGAA